MIKTIIWKVVLFINSQLLRIFGAYQFSEIFRKLAYRGMLFKLKKQNVKIGSNSVVYNTKFSYSSQGDSFFIGDNTTITGATLLGHDASPCVFLDELIVKKNVWSSGSRKSFRDPIRVGNNVFVGHGAIILPGVAIGDNTIVAAGSVVIKNLESDSVYAGNPAKKVKDIESYKCKYKSLLRDFPEKF
ncbi:acyltransferase [Pseudoalteromonas haloplanktis]|uniref:Acyltransferase n=1 Tax=Pseudoalteromonas haloplanktis TaxID=228 RepID=A0ABU1BKS9_PSEHA|nr:acyltransferase [Pseudoalteromonas haloplanktis]MDQ9094139.1 acyltransferase [Pseudoalteromonas haloplanktis]